jgi:hypothetical protein
MESWARRAGRRAFYARRSKIQHSGEDGSAIERGPSLLVPRHGKGMLAFGSASVT